ncbi:alginate lyase family protein [Kitasatospora atroaurantiaca]|nr:alginate lyase family protein [Kitasatospora atroaurantiaca]
MLKVGGGLAAGVGAAALAGGTAAAAGEALVHPGMLHTQADLDRMAAKVSAGAQPWKAGWDKLAANSHAQSGWRPNPQATVYRGSGTPENYGTLFNDVHAAYQNALRWRITGDRAHGDAARDILNTWSGTLRTVAGNADRFLCAGIQGYQFANAAELMRGYPGFDLDRFKAMMLTVFYPLNNDFLANHNGAFITNYWSSWDLLSVASVLAIGILCDDRAKVDQAVDYFKNGAGNGSVRNAIPVLHPGGLGQWTEAGRDQGHATLAVGLMAAVCEMAWNQGIDLYGYDDSRFLKGAEYVARWNLGQDVPYAPYTWRKGAPGKWSGEETFTAASPAARGNVRPIWEMIQNHYTKRRGLDAPYVTALAARVRPEGGGGNYGPNSGGFDQLGFGTLAFTRDAGVVTAPSPTPGRTTGSTGTAHPADSTPSTPTGGGQTSGGPSKGLASTGAGEAVTYSAVGGVLAIAAGSVLALRGRRRKATRGD